MLEILCADEPVARWRNDAVVRRLVTHQKRNKWGSRVVNEFKKKNGRCPAHTRATSRCIVQARATVPLCYAPVMQAKENGNSIFSSPLPAKHASLMSTWPQHIKHVGVLIGITSPAALSFQIKFAQRRGLAAEFVC